MKLPMFAPHLAQTADAAADGGSCQQEKQPVNLRDATQPRGLKAAWIGHMQGLPELPCPPFKTPSQNRPMPPVAASAVLGRSSIRDSPSIWLMGRHFHVKDAKSPRRGDAI